VLKRSVNDDGDCKTMLGEECVSALENHYRREATEIMTRGRCPEGSEWNITVPFQCASLIGGGRAGWEGCLVLVRTFYPFPIPTTTVKCDNHHISTHQLDQETASTPRSSPKHTTPATALHLPLTLP
jgi:hypothetical protein